MTKSQSCFYAYGGIILILAVHVACRPRHPDSQYEGIPYADSFYTGGPQTLPGRLQCEYYDLGGEGISYHDTDLVNSGSGMLNPKDGSYLHGFRQNEAVDISYTKFNADSIDNNPFNFVEPVKDQLYVGWTLPGEWLKYTVDVKSSGVYQLGLMYTSNQGGKISVATEGGIKRIEMKIPSTFVAEDTVPWRQWHHWNYIGNAAEMELQEGIQVLTVHTLTNGQMNYDYINFTLKNTK